MIRVQRLFKRFGGFEALKGIDFHVAAGTSVGLLGENGAGKTTTMRILSCFIAPTSGVVEVAGHPVVFESAAVRENIGYMPESVPIYGNMRVEEFLRYRARLKGVSAKSVRRAVDEAISKVDLTSRRRSLVQVLSKGLRQRVGLADALVHRPPVLILDEPTSGLDPSQRREVRELIRDLRGEHTVLVSSHILPEIETTCERVVIIHRGTVAASESIETLKHRYSEDRFRVAFFPSEIDVELLLREVPDVRLEKFEASGQHGLGHALLASPDGGASRHAVIAQLVSHGVRVHELTGVERTLEEAFLKAIQGEDVP